MFTGFWVTFISYIFFNFYASTPLLWKTYLLHRIHPEEIQNALLCGPEAFHKEIIDRQFIKITQWRLIPLRLTHGWHRSHPTGSPRASSAGAVIGDIPGLHHCGPSQGSVSRYEHQTTHWRICCSFDPHRWPFLEEASLRMILPKRSPHFPVPVCSLALELREQHIRRYIHEYAYCFDECKWYSSSE